MIEQFTKITDNEPIFIKQDHFRRDRWSESQPNDPHAWPPLNKVQKETRFERAWKYLKCNFANVIFTDESHTTIDGPDEWASDWAVKNRETAVRVRYVASCFGLKLIGLHKVECGANVDSKTYCDLLGEALLRWPDEH